MDEVSILKIINFIQGLSGLLWKDTQYYEP